MSTTFAALVAGAAVAYSVAACNSPSSLELGCPLSPLALDAPPAGPGAGATPATACYGAPELPAGCEDDSASMASALLLFAYHRSALLQSRPLALSGGGGDTLPEIPAPAPQMQRQDCPRRPSSSRSPPRRRAAACRRGGGRDARAAGLMRLDAGSAQPLGRP